MADYKYEAKKRDGSVVKGTATAKDEAELRSKLKGQGMSLVSLS